MIDENQMNCCCISDEERLELQKEYDRILEEIGENELERICDQILKKEKEV